MKVDGLLVRHGTEGAGGRGVSLGAAAGERRLLAGRLRRECHGYIGRRPVLGRDRYDIGGLLAPLDARLRALNAHAESGLGSRRAGAWASG